MRADPQEREERTIAEVAQTKPGSGSSMNIDGAGEGGGWGGGEALDSTTCLGRS